MDEDIDLDVDVDSDAELDSSKRKVKLLAAIVALMFLFMVMFLTVLKYRGLVYPNISFYNQSVAKLNEKELYKFLDDAESKIKDKKICVEAGGENYYITVGNLLEKSNKKYLCKQLTTHSGNILKEFGIILLDVKTDYKLELHLNNDNLNKEVKYIATKTNNKSTEPKVKIDGSSIKLIEGKDGIALNEKQLILGIKDILENIDFDNNNLKVVADYSKTSPNIDIEDLKCIDTKISSYFTGYGTGGARGSNIQNAASKLDNLLIMPGEEFSYEDTIGPTTAENGYRSAPVIVNGQLKSGLGGGVCQVSSTMYNAQLKAGILPSERSNHSKPVSYVPRGLDATLASGSIDYKFINTYDYPLVINAYTSSGRLYIEFWSNKNATKGITYEAKSYVSGRVANAYLLGYDKNGKQVYKRHIDTSVYR